MSTLSFKHSGTTGDLIYSLPIVQHFGGGEFYLHMNQIDWIGQHYYRSKPNLFHQGRMNQQDFDFLKDFMLAQKYVIKFRQLDPKTTEITHNLDRFRPLFVGHPGNYVDIYAAAFGISNAATRTRLRNQAWLTTPSPLTVQGRPVAINRTARWLPARLSNTWADLKMQGVPDQSFFLGLPEEYEAFCQVTGWDTVVYQPTKNLLELAQYIQGARTFIGNQSVALSVALGLGHTDIWCEARTDLPQSRNECYFPDREGLRYFS